MDRFPASTLGDAVKSEFYRLRRTAIKDIAAYLAFLGGFLGAAPFAWRLLAVQLEAGDFATGLWYFFGIVTAAGIFAGIAGLGAGMLAGLVWEQAHRHRRRSRGAIGEPEAEIARETTRIPPELELAPRLRLVAGAADPGVDEIAGARPRPTRAVEETAPPTLRLPSLPTARVGLRDLLLGLIVIGTIGLLAELLLQEHFESWQQWIPIVLLGAGLATSTLVRLRPGSATFVAFRGLMGLFVIAGLLGVYLHYAGNVEFEVERTPELSGLELFWEALRGATPALAPGALVQLGLLGFIYAYRHPAAERASDSLPDDRRESAGMENE